MRNAFVGDHLTGEMLQPGGSMIPASGRTVSLHFMPEQLIKKLLEK